MPGRLRVLDPLFLGAGAAQRRGLADSIEHQVLGPNTNLTNGATSGLMAVGLAMGAIQRREIDCAVVGGYDTLLVMDAIAEHHLEGRLSHHGSPGPGLAAPSTSGDGYAALGEGAAFVLLESEDHARGRGARAYAELQSFAATTDPSALRRDRAGDPTALREAGQRALAVARCAPADVGVVFGDGLGTEVDDRREAEAVLGMVSGVAVPFTAATSAIGYTGAAGGVFSLIHGVLAVDRGVAPALANCDQLDPRCPVHFLRRPEPMSQRRVVVWNSPAGVKNVAVVVAAGRDRWECALAARGGLAGSPPGGARCSSPPGSLPARDRLVFLRRGRCWSARRAPGTSARDLSRLPLASRETVPLRPGSPRPRAPRW